jgi:hypothetical protein
MRRLKSPNNNNISFTVTQINITNALNAITMAARMWYIHSPNFEMYLGIAADSLVGDKPANVKLLRELFLLPFFSVMTPDVSVTSNSILVAPKSCNCASQVNKPKPIVLLELV